MGFFDRLAGKHTPARTPSPASTPPPETPTPAGGLLPQLAAARDHLEAKDLAGAMSIYEQVLASAGDRPDVLVTISGDLGTCGYVEPIVELIAPRYDAERHGPATGLNLLQAYLATGNPTAAQHLLDILFALERPELETRLWGFSNAIAELIEAQRLAPAKGAGAKPAARVDLVSISKPIWAYGVDQLPGLLPSKEPGMRRVAFGQLSLVGVADIDDRAGKPEDALGRFTRGFPLWMAETLFFSRQYTPIAAVGVMNKAHYTLFPTEWTTDNIRQLVETSSEGLDYVFTGAVRELSGDTELILRLWEIKKFRERKQFTARWSPSTADEELAKLHEQVRLFMEWTAYPAGTGIAYVPPPQPSAWIQTLGASLTCFLADKNVLPKEQVVLPESVIQSAAAAAGSTESASIAWLTLKDRAARLEVTATFANPSLQSSPLVNSARGQLDHPPAS